MKIVIFVRLYQKPYQMKNNNETISIHEDSIVLSYMKLLNHLSIGLKLKLIAKLSESLSSDFEKQTVEVAEKKSWKSL